jgi:DNA-binding NtrC family response regulator
MPPRVVVVHDDQHFLDSAAAGLRLAGLDVVCYPGSMEALRGFQAAETIDLLITRVRFPEGTPHGLSLALMARYQRPGIKVLFAARPDMEMYTKALGELIRYPVDISELVENAMKLLGKDGKDTGVQRVAPDEADSLA